MKLTASRPVTIYQIDHSVIINPHMLRHPDGTLFLWLEGGHDSWFTTVFRMHSRDNGRTWVREDGNVPRFVAGHIFPDGELFEMDAYGYWDPKTPDTYVHYGAWSHPEKPNPEVKRDTVRARAPMHARLSMREVHKVRCYPNYPWWPLFNQILGKAECSQDEVFVGGPYMTDMLEHDGVLLGVAYWYLKEAGEAQANIRKEYCGTICFESRDRGHTWEQRGIVGLDPDKKINFTEATLTRLKDGRLYSLMRTYGTFHHAWSSDGGKTWTRPEPVKVVDADIKPTDNYPRCVALADGTLVLAYGRPGKHLLFDPSGTGRQWQGHVDLHARELASQEFMEVPPDLRLRGETAKSIRYWDSMDYLSLTAIGPREMLVCYDVQSYMENWNSKPCCAIRMVRVSLEDGTS